MNMTFEDNLIIKGFTKVLDKGTFYTNSSCIYVPKVEILKNRFFIDSDGISFTLMLKTNSYDYSLLEFTELDIEFFNKVWSNITKLYELD